VREFQPAGAVACALGAPLQVRAQERATAGSSSASTAMLVATVETAAGWSFPENCLRHCLPVEGGRW
jgi:hypothetical protein